MCVCLVAVSAVRQHWLGQEGCQPIRQHDICNLSSSLSISISSLTRLHCSGLRNSSSSLLPKFSHSHTLSPESPGISRSFISPLFSLTFPSCYSLPFHISFPLLSWFNTNIYLAHVSRYKLDRCAAFCGGFFVSFLQRTSVFLHKKNLTMRMLGKWLPFQKALYQAVFSFFLFFFWLSRALSTVEKKKKADLFLKSAYDIDCSFYQPDNHDRKEEDGGRKLFMTKNTRMIARHFLSTSTC